MDDIGTKNNVAVTLETATGTTVFEMPRRMPVLAGGLGAGIPLPYQCSTGTCGTCAATLRSGRVVPLWPENGWVEPAVDREFRLCQFAPAKDCTIRVRKSEVQTWPPSQPVPTELTGDVRLVEMLTHDVALVTVGLSNAITFAAGQYCTVQIQGIPGPRAYSMATFSNHTDKLQFVIKAKSGGKVSRWIFEEGCLGKAVRLFGPLGHSTFDPVTFQHNLVCIAGGSGIAPILAILDCAANTGYFNRYCADVFFGVRSLRDIFLVDRLVALHFRYPESIRVVIALSEEEGPVNEERIPGVTLSRGLVHAVARRHCRFSGRDAVAFLGGPPAMVDAAIRMLLAEMKFPAARIRFDKF